MEQQDKLELKAYYTKLDEFTAAQLNEIDLGIDCDIDVSLYANPRLTPAEMAERRKKLNEQRLESLEKEKRIKRLEEEKLNNSIKELEEQERNDRKILAYIGIVSFIALLIFTIVFMVMKFGMK